MSTPKKLKADVAIAGGGLVGLSLGIAICQHGLSVVVADAQPTNKVTNAAFDGRASAIAFSSYCMLKNIGIWPHLKLHPSPILEIRVLDGDSPFFLHFDSKELGEGPLGYMVENRHMRQALFARAAELETLTFLAPDAVLTMEHDEGSATLMLDSGVEIEASLVIAAEGRNSLLRARRSIEAQNWSYGQSGIVATIEHEYDHLNIAHERFLPEGPFAILPLNDNRSSLVWTVASDTAYEIMKLSDDAFLLEINKRTGDFLGRLKLVGGRWSYPLALVIAERFSDHRFALVGDAAHGIHPIAGQGLNLGLRDVAALTEIILEATHVGLDYGLASTLERYDRWRRTDTLALVASTDGLNRLFSNNIVPIRLARNLGLGIVQRLPGLKRFFMQHARGTVGDIPKLLKSENEPLPTVDI